MSSHIVEGELDFSAPNAGKPCKTWYRIVGDLSSDRTPLIVVHGGPGVNSEYLRKMEEVKGRYGVPVIRYDQIGCGKSTRLPEKMGDESFWTVDLFLAELENVLQKLGVSDNYNLYGHSWGGMLGVEHAMRRPAGLRRLIVSNSPASMPLWESAARRYLKAFPQELQDTVAKHEAEGTTDSEEYEAATTFFYSKHIITVYPWPEEVVFAFKDMAEDPTCYRTMIGPSEFTTTGNLKAWALTSAAVKSINVPVLLLTGRFDMADDEAVRTFVEGVPDLKRVHFEKSAHLPIHEEPEAYFKAVGEFLLP